MVYNNILEAIGHTPMIRLNRLNKPGNAEILVKFEGLNVGGSIKTRTAYNMIRIAEKEGKIKPDTIIVEPTSGNQGIGLALVGAVKGYKTIIIMPDSVSEERRKLVEKGAIGDMCLQFYDKDGNTDQYSFYNDRVAAMRLADIRRIPSKIGIAGGARKVDAVIGAIRGGFINILITDTECARKLIELAQQ